VSSSETGLARSVSASESELGPSAWWVRVLASLPLSVLYGFATVIGWLAFHVFPYRAKLVHTHLKLAFPERDEAGIRDIMRRYYAGFAQMLVEIIKSASMPPEEISRRVRIVGLEKPRELLAQGKSVLMVAAHQCNWEWMLLAICLELGYPVDAAYKPLVDPWAEREMKKVRTRFGSRLIPAKDLLPDMIKRRGVVRAIAMVADQEPTTSEHKHWTRFLNREEIVGADHQVHHHVGHLCVGEPLAVFLGLEQARVGSIAAVVTSRHLRLANAFDDALFSVDVGRTLPCYAFSSFLTPSD